MIVISKRDIISALKFILLIIGLAGLSLLLGVLEGWVIHRYLPEVENDPWFWARYTQTFAPAEEGCSIYCDLDKKILTLYENGEVIKTYPISGGAKKSPSPLGQWKVTYVENWGEGFGGSFIGFNCPWGQYGIHGTVEPWALGNTNSSHGCIRMKNKDVGELKKYVKWGTPIYIKCDNPVFRALKDGDRGSDVLELQEMLYTLGYLKAEPDGRFGQGTTKAVKAFQKENSLKVDGVVGWSTIERLKAACE